jgi:formate dehydrogenase subunit delta
MSDAMNTDEKLIYMANQIAAFFAAQGEARAVPAVADHIRKFWTPKMRRKLVNLSEAGHVALDALVCQAVRLIGRP